MFIIQIKGGLGNQINQYALGRSLALKNNCELKLDLSWFDKINSSCTYRTFKLDRFNIKAKIAEKDEIAKIKGDSNLFYKIDRFKAKYIPFINKTYIIENRNKFDKSILKLKPPVYLEGYWHSYKYHEQIQNELTDDFTLSETLGHRNNDLKLKISNSNSISIHVRRGDYVSNTENYKRFGVCSQDYYKRSIEYMKRFVPDPLFFFFSDDYEWVKKNLKIDGCQSIYLDQEYPEKDCVDLWLMTFCKHHIIANSTYSWWGAWLANHKDKIVILPKKWNNIEMIINYDRSPPNWIMF